MRNFLTLALGVSILLGLFIGKLTSETKYYLFGPNGSVEVTKGYFDDVKQKSGSDRLYKSTILNLSEEKKFNTQNAVLGGLCSLGGLMVIFSIFQMVKNQPFLPRPLN